MGESALPWLITTARYLALNRRPSPESVAIGSEALRQIKNVMVTLPTVDQRIFDLCLMDDLSYDQAARRLGISHSTVRNRLSRLKGRLRAELALLKGEPTHAAE